MNESPSKHANRLEEATGELSESRCNYIELLELGMESFSAEARPVWIVRLTAGHVIS